MEFNREQSGGLGLGNSANVAVLLTDRKYLPAALFVAQKLSRQRSRNFDIRLLVTECPEAVRETLDDGITIQDFVPDERAQRTASLKKKPPIAFGRLTMDSVLPEHYQKILYLDCNLWIGNREISQLFAMDLDGFAFGAVCDAGEIVRATDPIWLDYKRQLGLDDDTPYFNSGVMMIDRNEFKKQRIGDRSLEYIANGGYLGMMNDQSALNAVTKGQWRQLSPIWNWMFGSRARLTEETDPAIIHFIGPQKFWNDTRGRFAPKYRQDMTAYLKTLGYEAFVQETPQIFRVRRAIKQFGFDALAAVGANKRELLIRSALAAHSVRVSSV